MSNRMFMTRNSIPLDTRRKVIDICNQQLADSADLMLQAKHAHFNVKGSNALFFHRFFDEIFGMMVEQTDTIAERAAMLGAFVPSTARAAVAASRLPEMPMDIDDETDYLAAMAERVAMVANSNRAAIDATMELNDQVTADMFIALTDELDKQLWFIETHLQ